METLAVIMRAPRDLAIGPVLLSSPGEEDVVVDIEWSGISTGTERLLWSGKMPPFPGMGYPLVPGYESVGKVAIAGPRSGASVGDRVFVPGARCFGDIRGLFGGAAKRVVVPGLRIVALQDNLAESGVLLALAATAYHAMSGSHPPDLIVGHGVLGRLLARVATASGGSPPVIWEVNPERRGGALGYEVVDPNTDERRDYRAIYDVSGDSTQLDRLIAHLGPGGEIVLAGFYDLRPSFDFAPAFRRELRLRVAAEWKPSDLDAILALLRQERLSLDGLITHRESAASAAQAYETAFQDPSCLKMVLDWRNC